MPHSREATLLKQDAFLASLIKTGSVKQSLESADVKHATFAMWKFRDTHGFKERFARSLEIRNDARLEALEEQMFAALEWVSLPENYDKLIRYPTLLMFALKAGRPMYRDSNQVVAAGAADLLSAITKLSDGEKAPAPEVLSPLAVSDSEGACEINHTLDSQLTEILSREDK